MNACTARDKAGNYGAEKTLKSKALKEPETSFGIGGNYRGLNGSEAVGKGSWLRIYAATAVSEIFADGRSEIAEAALYRDGELYKETSFSAEEDTDVLLEDEGGYELVYSVKGYKDLKYTVAFTVTASGSRVRAFRTAAAESCGRYGICRTRAHGVVRRREQAGHRPPCTRRRQGAAARKQSRP